MPVHAIAASPLSHEIGAFKAMLDARRLGQVTESEWRPLRGRWGVHKCRQDNEFMLRVRVAGGRLSLGQFREAGNLAAQSRARQPIHLSTRQDLQYYGLDLGEIPAMLQRLERAGLSSFLTGGNSVRNIACPAASGLMPDEPFDPYPAARALTEALLLTAEFHELPRKFKISFDSASSRGGLAWYQDLGLHALLQPGPQGPERGYRVSVGGGLGAAPQAGQIYSDFIPERRLLSHVSAILAHFNENGDRGNRALGRLKHLLRKEGLPRFCQDVERIRLERFDGLDFRPLRPADPAPPRSSFTPHSSEGGFAPWLRANVARQRQDGYFRAMIQVPLGQLEAFQAQGITAWMEGEGLDDIRLDWGQNLLLPWIPAPRLPGLYACLVSLNLAGQFPSSALDPVSCPGISSCNRARHATRALASDISQRMRQRPDLAAETASLSVAVSGCANGCSQHLLASAGFQGRSRLFNGRFIPQYQLHVRPSSAAPQLAPLGVFPARKAALALERLLEAWTASRRQGEDFGAWATALDGQRRDSLLGDLSLLKGDDPGLFMDNGSQEPFQAGRLGASEC